MFWQAIFDRAEVRAVAAALADVERRLAEAAMLRIGLAEIGDVIDPALLGARADVEVDALNRFERADAVLAALEDVVHLLGLAAIAAQHLSVRPGSHQQASLVGAGRARRAPAATSSPVPRTSAAARRLMIGFIVPGLLT